MNQRNISSVVVIKTWRGHLDFNAVSYSNNETLLLPVGIQRLVVKDTAFKSTSEWVFDKILVVDAYGKK